MKVESIAECSKAWSILQYFGPALSDNLSWKPILVFFLSGRLRQVLLYTCTCTCMWIHVHVCGSDNPTKDMDTFPSDTKNTGNKLINFSLHTCMMKRLEFFCRTGLSSLSIYDLLQYKRKREKWMFKRAQLVIIFHFVPFQNCRLNMFPDSLIHVLLTPVFPQ